MKSVVAKEVDMLLHRPSISEKAQYYAVLFLSQLKLSRGDKEFAKQLIGTYFDLFSLKAAPTSQGAEQKQKQTGKGTQLRNYATIICACFLFCAVWSEAWFFLLAMTPSCCSG